MNTRKINAAEKLISKITEETHTNEEWLLLEKDVKALFESASTEDAAVFDALFVESGAGEMLHMICSGIRLKKD